MLADDAFLRQLPTGIAPEEGVLIETLVYCADAGETSYDAIRLTALTHGPPGRAIHGSQCPRATVHRAASPQRPSRRRR